MIPSDWMKVEKWHSTLQTYTCQRHSAPTFLAFLAAPTEFLRRSDTVISLDICPGSTLSTARLLSLGFCRFLTRSHDVFEEQLQLSSLHFLAIPWSATCKLVHCKFAPTAQGNTEVRPSLIYETAESVLLILLAKKRVKSCKIE